MTKPGTELLKCGIVCNVDCDAVIRSVCKFQHIGQVVLLSNVL